MVSLGTMIAHNNVEKVFGSEELRNHAYRFLTCLEQEKINEHTIADLIGKTYPLEDTEYSVYVLELAREEEHRTYLAGYGRPFHPMPFTIQLFPVFDVSSMTVLSKKPPTRFESDLFENIGKDTWIKQYESYSIEPAKDDLAIIMNDFF
jgi:hypothetical protein